MAEFGESQEFSSKDKHIERKPTVEVEPLREEAREFPSTLEVNSPKKDLPIMQSKEEVSTKKPTELEITANRYKGLPVIGIPKYIPFGAVHVGGRIYLKYSLFKDFQSGDPKPETLAILAHEHTHFERMGAGIKDQVFKYWTHPKYRFQEELAAIQNQMKVLKQHGQPFDIKETARFLSGPLYLLCVKYRTAEQELEKIWNEIEV